MNAITYTEFQDKGVVSPPCVKKVDDHQPGAKWEFNADVAVKFDDMLGRSIPGYLQMRELAYELGKKFIPDQNVNVIDLGASRGESASAFIDTPAFSGANYFLSEVSEPMLDQMRERWNGVSNVHPVSYDLRRKYTDIAYAIHDPVRNMVNNGKIPSTPYTLHPTTLVQAILTLIFVPINFRQGILKGVHEGLAPGGAFIMVEKVLGDSAEMQDLLVDAYHDHKHRHGYSWEDIERKRAALEGVQVPVRHEENIAMLRSAGFRNVETFWRHLNFVGYICIKDQ